MSPASRRGPAERRDGRGPVKAGRRRPERADPGRAQAGSHGEPAQPWSATLPTVVVAEGVVATTPLLQAPDVDALVLPVAPAAEGDEGVQPRTGTADAAARYGIDLADLVERLDLTGAAGEVQTVHLPRGIGSGGDLPWACLPARLVVVGIGSGESRDLRRAGAAIARSTRGLRRVVATVAADVSADATRALVEGYLLGAYRHPSRAGAAASAPQAPAAELVLLGGHDADAVLSAQRASAAGWTARALTVTPSDTKNPGWLADRATELAERQGLAVEVLGREELEARGFGGLLAVGRGSATAPRLVTVGYTPPSSPGGPETVRHVVLVGKGITFDTGGLSIKPRESMVAMKTDMAGAAVALAAVLGAADAGVPHRVTAVLALAENAVGGAAYRPGDVLRVYGGTSVEVANTDAEGRLVLADALSHADLDLDPDVVVDVATLTGAATLGLGRHHGALFTPDDALADELVAAGADTGEALWRMPLTSEYAPALVSSVADIRHVATDAGVGAGAITAALFLQRFAGARRWAHLDIAGPARATSASHEVPEGATGFGARLLLRWLTALS